MDANRVTEQAGHKGQEIKETAQQWAEKAKGTARDAGAAADLYLHEYAWTTVLTVGVAAFVLGFVLGRSQ